MLDHVSITVSDMSDVPAGIADRAQLPLRAQPLLLCQAGRFGGVPYRELQRSLGEGDLAALRNVKLMIIEENESLIGRSNYIDEMLRIVGR